MSAMRFIWRYVSALLVAIAVALTCVVICRYVFRNYQDVYSVYTKSSVIQQINPLTSTTTQRSCRFHSCFDIFRCMPGNDWKLSVYVYPKTRFVTKNRRNEDLFPEYSYEFEEFLDSLRKSSFSTTNISQACLLVPPIDFLSEKGINLDLASAALHSLDG